MDDSTVNRPFTGGGAVMGVISSPVSDSIWNCSQWLSSPNTRVWPEKLTIFSFANMDSLGRKRLFCNSSVTVTWACILAANSGNNRHSAAERQRRAYIVVETVSGQFKFIPVIQTLGQAHLIKTKIALRRTCA